MKLTKDLPAMNREPRTPMGCLRTPDGWHSMGAWRNKTRRDDAGAVELAILRTCSVQSEILCCTHCKYQLPTVAAVIHSRMIATGNYALAIRMLRELGKKMPN